MDSPDGASLHNSARGGGKLPQTVLCRPEPADSDASDYGIGGYIFQLDGTRELPIRFISNDLHKSQLNLSTIEKEAFSIFYTVTKFDFLLRDVKFVVETDHKNLTFLKTAQSAKVGDGSSLYKSLIFATSTFLE